MKRPMRTLRRGGREVRHRIIRLKATGDSGLVTGEWVLLVAGVLAAAAVAVAVITAFVNSALGSIPGV